MDQLLYWTATCCCTWSCFVLNPTAENGVVQKIWNSNSEKLTHPAEQCHQFIFVPKFNKNFVWKEGCPKNVSKKKNFLAFIYKLGKSANPTVRHLLHSKIVRKVFKINPNRWKSMAFSTRNVVTWVGTACFSHSFTTLHTLF